MDMEKIFKKSKKNSESEEDFYELEHSMLKQNGIKIFFSNIFEKTEPFFLITGSALAVVIIFFLVLILRGSKPGNNAQLEKIEKAIVKIEKKITDYDKIFASFDQIKIQITDYKAAEGRHKNISAAISIRLNLLEKEIEALNAKKINNKIFAKSDKKRKSVLQKNNRNSVKYYRVRPGDTLYSIGRKYNLTVNKLLSYNRSIVKNAIFPGQKLNVGI